MGIPATINGRSRVTKTGMRRLTIGVIGDARMERRSKKWKLTVLLGERLVDEGFRVVSGGHGGLAEALGEGVRRSKKHADGDIITILPGYDPSVADAYSDITIATGLDHARNLLVANSDAVIAVGGGAGTLSEMAFAWALDRLILAYRVGGWSGRLAGLRIDDRVRYPELRDDKVYPVETADDVIASLHKLLPKYNRRHDRIVIRSGSKSSDAGPSERESSGTASL